MLASSFLDPVLGIDIHFEMVPTPAPVPTPIPNPFIGLVFDPIGLAFGIALGAAIGAVVGAPFHGPVLYWTAFPATNTGTEAKHVTGHILIPPGVAWAPFPKTPKPVIHPGETPKPALPIKPENDAVVITGSKTVSVMGSNAARLGDIALSCSEPLRLPSSVVLAIPKGAPIVIGGPMSLDLMAALLASLRTRFVSDSLHALLSRLKPSRMRNLLNRVVCFLTGHPVDVATGKVLTSFVDAELPGPLPLTIERHYSSAFAARPGPLGHGWSLSLDQAVWRERGKVVLLTADGREVEFDTFDHENHRIEPGQDIYQPIDRLTLHCEADGRWRVVDHEGTTREFAPVPGRADGRAMLTQIRTRGDDHHITFTYDRDGRLHRVRDSGGRELGLRHDEHGRVSELLLPRPQGGGSYCHRRYMYDEEGDLVEVVDSLAHRWRFAYVGHLLTQETDREGLSFYFAYDGLGEDAWCVRTWGDGGIYDHVIGYDKQKHSAFVTDSLGHTTQYHCNIIGQVVRHVDPLGGETRYEYDPVSLRQTAEIDPLGRETRYVYDARGACTEIHRADGSVYTYEFDADGLQVAAGLPHGASWRWTHDERQRLRTRTDPCGATTRFHFEAGLLTRIDAPDGLTDSFEYDERGLLRVSSRADGGEIRVERDALGRVLTHRNRRGGTQRRRWDSEGRLIELQEPHGVVRRFDYDAEGKLVRAAFDGRAIEFAYAVRDRVCARSEAGTTTSLEHDSEGRVLAVIDADGDRHTFEYDEAGRVVAETTAAGVTRRYTRDAAGQAVAVQAGAVRRTLGHDAVGRLVDVDFGDGGFERYRYRADGNLLAAESPDATVEFSLDANGRVLTERLVDVRGRAHAVHSHYSGGGRRVRVDDGEDLSLYIERARTGAVARIELCDPNPRWSARIERDPDGLERQVTLGDAAAQTWTRDPIGRPLTCGVDGPRGTLDFSQFTWEGDARLIREHSSQWGERALIHDRRARPVGATIDGATQARPLDPAGHPTATPAGDDRVSGPGGRLLRLGDVTYTYDDNGRPTARDEADGRRTRFTWSDAGLLREVALPDGRVVRFTYDVFARRIGKTVVVLAEDGAERVLAEQRWSWDGGALLHEWSSEHGETRWVHDPDTLRPLAQICGDEVFSVVTDALGTPTDLVDERGERRWSGRIDLDGRMHEVGDVRQPLRWPGQYHDSETGLHYNRFRYYAPDAGMYLTPDPTGLRGGLRAYGYPLDPLNFADVLAWIGEFIWRAVRPEEIDRARTDGLTAKDPGASKTPFEHVYHGSDDGFKSQYISTSDSEKMANQWGKESGVVKIDVSKLDPDSIVDLSTGEGRARHLGDISAAAPDSPLAQANKWARGKKEILIVGHVPADAIVEVRDNRSSSCT